MSGDEALRRLMEGNDRFMRGWLAHPNRSVERRVEVARGQAPFAAVLGCSDSRVPIEIVFDQGLGDLFVIRVAGNVSDQEEVLASIEFAVVALHVPLVLVLGHTGCGAVQATLRMVQHGESAGGHIARLVEAIRPAVETARGWEGDTLLNAVKANVDLVVSQLRHSQPLLVGMVARGALKIVGALYDLETGLVEVIVP